MHILVLSCPTLMSRLSDWAAQKCYIDYIGRLLLLSFFLKNYNRYQICTCHKSWFNLHPMWGYFYLILCHEEFGPFCVFIKWVSLSYTVYSKFKKIVMVLAKFLNTYVCRSIITSHIQFVQVTRFSLICLSNDPFYSKKNK